MGCHFSIVIKSIFADFLSVEVISGVGLKIHGCENELFLRDGEQASKPENDDFLEIT
jgi:hypothetical protein